MKAMKTLLAIAGLALALVAAPRAALAQGAYVGPAPQYSWLDPADHTAGYLLKTSEVVFLSPAPGSDISVQYAFITDPALIGAQTDKVPWQNLEDIGGSGVVTHAAVNGTYQLAIPVPQAKDAQGNVVPVLAVYFITHGKTYSVRTNYYTPSGDPRLVPLVKSSWLAPAKRAVARVARR